MLTIETLLHNGIISAKLFAGRTTFRLSEVLNKLVNTNLRVSHNIIDNIEDVTTKEEFATIKTEILNLKSDKKAFLIYCITLLKMRKAKRNHETEFAVKIKIFKR